MRAFVCPPLGACLAAALAGCAADDGEDSSGAGAADAGYRPDPGPPEVRCDPVDLGGETGRTGAGAPGAIRFLDATEAAGLGGVTPVSDQHGGGLAWIDHDGDGRPDLFVAEGTDGRRAGTSALYRNRGDGTFQDVTATAGPDLAGANAYSVTFGDFDNDGDPDLYVAVHPGNLLFLNDGGSFSDATAARGAADPQPTTFEGDSNPKLATFVDYDSDGWLDLFAASGRYAGGPRAFLLRNRGDGTFEDATAAAGIDAGTRGNPCALLWSDFDDDRDLDLFLFNDRAPAPSGRRVYQSVSAGASFREVTASVMDPGFAFGHPMGIDGGDVDHDGDLDYYISNIGHHPLLRNQGGGRFSDVSAQAGTAGDFGWGVGFSDFDHDRDLDLFVTQEDDLPHLVYSNRGDGTFDRAEVPHLPVEDAGAAHNVPAAFADYDGDGRVDVAVANTDGTRMHLLRNVTDTGDNRWLHVRVRGNGATDNASGIGARVRVTTGDGLVQIRDVTGQSSRDSQNDLPVEFGLGPFAGADTVEVLWPSGMAQTFHDVPGGSVFEVEQPADCAGGRGRPDAGAARGAGGAPDGGG